MHILIVDDEALARSRMLALLADALPDTELHIEEASDALQAMAALQRHPFDVLLLDIHMPNISGLNLAREVRHMERPPATIFVTAHAEHAVQAFELEAVDYLTKPVIRGRLSQALEKAQRWLQQQRQDSPQEERHLLIHDRGRVIRLPLSEVIYFKAELKYITVRTEQGTYVLDGSLTDIEKQYQDDYLRIHRNALVAKRSMQAVDKDPDIEDGWAVRLIGVPEMLAISRRQLSAVRNAIQNL